MNIDRLLIATGNENKFNEMQKEFQELGIECIFPANIDIELERPEVGETYHENARIKAEEGYDKIGLPSLADDSGLEVDALDGAPGVYSDRWAGDNADASDRNQLLLEKLQGVKTPERTARFICEMVLFDESGERIKTRGVCEGRIAKEPSGDRGFGYDPVFEVKEAEWKTFASLNPEVKQWISHRALALNQMISYLRDEFE